MSTVNHVSNEQRSKETKQPPISSPVAARADLPLRHFDAVWLMIDVLTRHL